MWTERQTAMLKAMGLRLWSSPGEAAAPHDGAVSEALTKVQAEALAKTQGDRVAVPAVPAVAEPLPPTPGASRIAAMDWPALRAAVAGCQACALSATRRQTVFGSGHPQAQWLIVGEAPGEQEDASGEPFVGAAGQLLDAMLRALQLTRDVDGDLPPAQRVFIANTLKCRPPGNRNPAPEEMAQCEPYLVRQIELLRPRLILAMGRFAVQSLLRSSEPLGRLRGRVHQYQGVPLIVTYHPAYLLRSPGEKAKAWEDLCLAAQTMEDAKV